jgi:hypothetical protein
MKINYLLPAAIIFAGSLLSTQAAPKEDVAKAIKELEGNYSWVSTSKRPESTGGNSSRWQSGPTEGKTADGTVYLKSTRGDRTSESLIKGKKAATKGDSGWMMVEEASAGEENAEQRRRNWRGRYLQSFKSPATQAEELLAKITEIKKDGDTYSGDLSEEAAKALVSFGGGRTRGGGDDAAAMRPQPTGVKASAKFWIKDGILAKYETTIAGKIKYNDQERDLARTTTVEIKEVGKTKIEIPEDVKKGLDAKDAAKPE